MGGMHDGKDIRNKLPVNQPYVGFLLGEAAKLYTVEDEALLTSVYWM